MALIPTGSVRRRSTRRGVRWAIYSAMRYVLAVADDVLVAGEGIETMLSLRCMLPTMPMAAALSANHLAALLLPLSSVASISLAMRIQPGRGAAATLRSGQGKRHRGDFHCRHARRLQRGSRTLGIEALRATLQAALAGGHRPLLTLTTTDTA